ncbi:Uncharacterized protein Adt_15490 [Abeliophyllum distichum]|uniref:Uncharacterized protein n=1 Tax=Abeliophyllum distichum TaxID=126358 RepID=A0ABD1U3H4_9LAMI
MSSNGNPKSFRHPNNSSKTEIEEEKKEKSVKDVLAEAVAGADSMPRAKWIVGKEPAEPPAKKPEKEEENNVASVLGAVTAVVGVAAGVAFVARGLWNLAYPESGPGQGGPGRGGAWAVAADVLANLIPDPKPETEEEKKKKMMKAPGRRPYKIPRDEFEENPRDYFRKLRGR